jgi:phosphoribosylformylglycinamidine cyclo-ligase|tara:strand:- start:36 stop:959 length:924 start_codon:yes stop_codon:yes gene_type:complete
MDYKTSGVDIEAGNAFVDQLKEKAPSIGGFGGMFKVPAGYEKPVLVSGADGVGTKINIARVNNDYSTIGIDLVAMCVNDVITSGAKPLYFLDYISTQKLDANVASIVDGIIKGCWMAGCELLGGETAEHFRQREYDLAGFCTGIVEEFDVVDGSIIKPGDAIIGIQSSGLHSNGYTLINDMLWRHKLYYKETPELLEPTRIYAATVQRLLDEVPVLGMAHITGGGLVDNVSRCLPKGLQAHIDWNSWPLPEIFSKVMLAGEIPEEEMKRVFNMGIGYCVVVPPEVVDDAMILIDYPSQVIGHVRCTM